MTIGRTEEVVALARRGINPARIAIELGVEPDYAQRVLKKARAADPTVPSFDHTGRPIGAILIDEPKVQDTAPTVNLRARIAELKARRFGPVAIASLLRCSYAAIAEVEREMGAAR